MEPAACEVVVGSCDPRSEEFPARPPLLRLPRTSLSRAPSAASPIFAASSDRFRPPMPTSGDPGRWRPNQWSVASHFRKEQFTRANVGCQHLSNLKIRTEEVDFTGERAFRVHSYNLSRLIRTTKLRLRAAHGFSSAQAIRLSSRAPSPSVLQVRDNRVDVLVQRRVSRRLAFPFRRQRVARC